MPRDLLEERIYRYLCAQLNNQQLTRGAHLNAGDLAAQLKVSRTSVRKAILRLIAEGCVQLNEARRPIVVGLPKKRKATAESSFTFTNQTEYAYWAIFDAIFDGQLRVGANVNGQELAARIGVSLGTVRQSLDWLCRDGLLLRLPRRGWQVVQLDGRGMADAFQIRLLLEREVLNRAIQRIKPKALEDLIAENGAVVRDVESMAEETRRRVDYRFHRTLLDACDSPILTQTVDPLIRKCILTISSFQLPPDRIHEAFAEHIEIARALLREDLSLARDLLHKHFTRSVNLCQSQEKNALR